MKRLSVLLVFVLMAAAVVPAHAAPAQYPTELAYMDAQVNLMLPYLAQFEAQFYAVNGRYYQALISNSTAPAVPVIPDGIYASPTDQAASLAYFWQYASLPDALGWAFKIDVYSGTSGSGYVLTVETVLDGQTWMRSINTGPDSWRDQPWSVVEG